MNVSENIHNYFQWLEKRRLNCSRHWKILQPVERYT